MADSPSNASAGANQPPYIKHVHLRNVPPLRDVTTDFKPGLNVIIGKNGSGKTNFLKLIAQLTNAFSTKNRGDYCEVVFDGAQELSLTFREQKASPEETDENFDSSEGANRPSVLIRVEGKGGVWEGSSIRKAMFDNDRRMAYDLVSVWHGIPMRRLPIIDTGVELVMPKHDWISFGNSSVSRWGIASRQTRAFLQTIELINFSSDLEDIYSSEESVIRRFIKNTVDTHLGRLSTYLSTYSPIEEIRSSEQFQVYRNSTNDELIIKGLVLEYKIGDDWLPFYSLSDGTKRIFYLISEMVAATSSSARSSEEVMLVDANRIILLEEPELGIHPDQLQLLLQLIREVSRKHQVIMTTHSPQTLDILNRDELDRISICEYVPGKGTQMRKLSATKQAKARAYLRDEGFLSEFWRFSNLEDPD